MTTPELPPLHWVGAMRIDNASFQSLATEASVYARERILQARIAELEADAARYRWLREQGDYGCTEKDGYGGQRLMTGEQLDAAIDAARH